MPSSSQRDEEAKDREERDHDPDAQDSDIEDDSPSSPPPTWDNRKRCWEDLPGGYEAKNWDDCQRFHNQCIEQVESGAITCKISQREQFSEAKQHFEDQESFRNWRESNPEECENFCSFCANSELFVHSFPGWRRKATEREEIRRGNDGQHVSAHVVSTHLL